MLQISFMRKATLVTITFLSAISFIPARLKAQVVPVKKPGLTVGANFIYSIPQGNFKNAYQFGVGGELFAGVGFGSTYIIGSIGVAGYKHQASFSNTLTSVPIKVGLKKYFLLKKIFINGDMGVASVKAGGQGSGAFTAGFGAGVKLLGIELSLYQNTFKNTGAYSNVGYSNSLNVKIGWTYGL